MESPSFYEKLLIRYDQKLDHSGIKGERLATRLAEIAEIGLSEDGGVTRTGYSKEEKKAKELVSSWMEAIGMKVRTDGAGNVFGLFEGKSRNPAVASGSHLDSVPNGGNFDGPLGVLAALEIAEAWHATGFVPEKPYMVIVFSDEEGSRFKSGLTGSRAFMGQIDIEELNRLKDENGQTFEEVIEQYGSTIATYLEAKQQGKIIESFTEVHIEQGTVLETANQPVGVVNGIAGPAWLEITFKGEAAHAGNTPMAKRKDPLVAASIFIRKLEELPMKISDSAVATVGKLDVSPNGTNVIAGEVTMIVDVRDIFEDNRDQLVDSVIAEAKGIAESRQIVVEISVNTKITPLPIEKNRQEGLVQSLATFGIAPYYIPSGAGHDAMIVGREIPSSMIFVRSKGGISHNPKEWTTLNDCVLAVHVLKHYLEGLMEKE